MEKQTKNFFKVAKNLATLGGNLSTKEESESQPVGNSDKYNLSAKGGNCHAETNLLGLYIDIAKRESDKQPQQRMRNE